jgi:type IV pilus assembly protein PilN
MIRINLLGVPKQKKGKRAAVPGIPGGGGGPSPLVVVLVLLVIAAAGNYYYYSTLQKDAVKLQADLQAERAKNLRLAETKAKYMELEKQKDLYERRVNVIHQLQANQSGPVELLTQIADTVNRTDAVWLNTMKDDGNNIALDGVALSVDAVAMLMKNLKATGYFRSVEIRETSQDNVEKDVTAFVFTLVCERQPQKKS